MYAFVNIVPMQWLWKGKSRTGFLSTGACPVPTATLAHMHLHLLHPHPLPFKFTRNCFFHGKTSEQKWWACKLLVYRFCCSRKLSFVSSVVISGCQGVFVKRDRQFLRLPHLSLPEKRKAVLIVSGQPIHSTTK